MSGLCDAFDSAEFPRILSPNMFRFMSIHLSNLVMKFPSEFL